MKETVYDFTIELNWKLLSDVSKLDRFDASWSSIEKTEGQSLKQLKEVATVESVGASTRIEGSKLSDAQVQELIKKIDITKLDDRDSQEVVGYFNVLDVVTESYLDIEIATSSLKNLHNLLLKLSQKDDRHRGDFKQHENAVQATFPDGSSQIIFKTTEPGITTTDAITKLIKWYHQKKEVHPLIVAAAFVYEFLSIHPFQDGNGRLARILTTLLLLKSGYKWIEYVSFEHEIENHKKEYYKVLRNCQAQRPEEEITEWINFFIKSLLNIQSKLDKKIETVSMNKDLSPKEKLVLTYILNNPGCRSGQIAQNTNISKPTVKRIITHLLANKLIKKFGIKAGTNYSATA
ncbi:Fic family protein [Chitinophagales bacterium]|nr:Fic family protein [Chitinophagales bacterium]